MMSLFAGDIKGGRFDKPDKVGALLCVMMAKRRIVMVALLVRRCGYERNVFYVDKESEKSRNGRRIAY